MVSIDKIEKIESDKAFIIPFSIKHASSEKYLKWLRDYDVIKTLNLLSYVEKNVSKKELLEYFSVLKRDRNCKFFALYFKKDNAFIGTVKLSKIDLKTNIADVGIMIGEKSYWGRGIAQNILSSLCHHLFENCNFRKLTSGLMSINIPMYKVFLNLGFKEEGKFRKVDLFEGKYTDHIYMGCFRDEFRRNNIK